jgi:hypothetical protein
MPRAASPMRLRTSSRTTSGSRSSAAARVLRAASSSRGEFPHDMRHFASRRLRSPFVLAGNLGPTVMRRDSSASMTHVKPPRPRAAAWPNAAPGPSAAPGTGLKASHAAASSKPQLHVFRLGALLAGPSEMGERASQKRVQWRLWLCVVLARSWRASFGAGDVVDSRARTTGHLADRLFDAAIKIVRVGRQQGRVPSCCTEDGNDCAAGLLALRAQRLRRPRDATSTHASRILASDAERWSDEVPYCEPLAQSPRTWSGSEAVLPPASPSSAQALTNAKLGAKRLTPFAAAAFEARSARRAAATLNVPRLVPRLVASPWLPYRRSGAIGRRSS